MVSLVYSCVASYVVHIRAMGETSSKRKLAALQRSKFHFQTLVTDLYQDTFHFYLEKRGLGQNTTEDILSMSE